ncbi:MYXO-CTERM sorting domain-containing protein, partial [Myxococcota bacterium]
SLGCAGVTPTGTLVGLVLLVLRRRGFCLPKRTAAGFPARRVVFFVYNLATAVDRSLRDLSDFSRVGSAQTLLIFLLAQTVPIRRGK